MSLSCEEIPGHCLKSIPSQCPENYLLMLLRNRIKLIDLLIFSSPLAEEYCLCDVDQRNESSVAATEEKIDTKLTEKQPNERNETKLEDEEAEAKLDEEVTVKSYYKDSKVSFREKLNTKDASGSKTWSLTDDTPVPNMKQRKGIIYQTKSKVDTDSICSLSSLLHFSFYYSFSCFKHRLLSVEEFLSAHHTSLVVLLRRDLCLSGAISIQAVIILLIFVGTFVECFTSS